MNVGIKCKQLIERSEMQQKEVAAKVGMTKQNLCNKLSRNRLSAEEFVNIVDVLGYEVKIVNKKNDEDFVAYQKGVGPRLKMMISGVRYDTYKANAICHTDCSLPSYDEVYQDDEGRYFVAHYVNWDGGINSISPISEDAAIDLIKQYAD